MWGIKGTRWPIGQSAESDDYVKGKDNGEEKEHDEELDEKKEDVGVDPTYLDLVFKGRHLGAPFSCSPALNLICWWCTAGNPACPRGLFSGVYGGPRGVIETPLESFWALL